VSNSELKRGDVYLAEINYVGHDENLKHLKFVVILQSGKLFTNSDTVSVLVLTTKHLDRMYHTDVFVAAKECGAAKGAKILANQPHTILKSQLVQWKYTLSETTIEKMNVALAVGVGLIAA